MSLCGRGNEADEKWLWGRKWGWRGWGSGNEDNEKWPCEGEKIKIMWNEGEEMRWWKVALRGKGNEGNVSVRERGNEVMMNCCAFHTISAC